jgi:hypothetical protein
MLYQKDPKYAHLPHSEWLKTPDGDRYRQALAQYGNPTARTLDLRPEDRIRDLMRRPGRRPVSEGKGPPPGKPPKPGPGYDIDPGFECHTVCDMHGNQTRACGSKPDPKCKRKGDFDGVPLLPNWGPGAWDDSAGRPQWRPANDKTKPGWSAGMTQYQR